MRVVVEQPKIERNPLLPETKDLDFANTLYPKLGITREQDQQKFVKYIEDNKYCFKPPDLEPKVYYEGATMPGKVPIGFSSSGKLIWGLEAIPKTLQQEKISEGLRLAHKRRKANQVKSKKPKKTSRKKHSKNQTKKK